MLMMDKLFYGQRPKDTRGAVMNQTIIVELGPPDFSYPSKFKRFSVDLRLNFLFCFG